MSLIGYSHNLNVSMVATVGSEVNRKSSCACGRWPRLRNAVGRTLWFFSLSSCVTVSGSSQSAQMLLVLKLPNALKIRASPPQLCPSHAAEVVAANSLNSEAVMVMIYLLSLCNPNIHTHTDTHQPTAPCALLIRFPHQPAAATALSLLWDPKFPPSRTLGL